MRLTSARLEIAIKNYDQRAALAIFRNHHLITLCARVWRARVPSVPALALAWVRDGSRVAP